MALEITDVCELLNGATAMQRDDHVEAPTTWASHAQAAHGAEPQAGARRAVLRPRPVTQPGGKIPKSDLCTRYGV